MASTTRHHSAKPLPKQTGKMAVATAGFLLLGVLGILGRHQALQQSVQLLVADTQGTSPRSRMDEPQIQQALNLAAQHHNHGNTRRDQGELKEALDDYGTAIRLQLEVLNQRESGEILDNLSISYMNRGNVLRDQRS